MGVAKSPLPIIMNMTRLKEGLSLLKDDYDYIFIDVPPFLISAETQAAVRISDVTVVVVEADGTTWPALKKTMTSLDETGVSVVAVVLNRVKIMKSGRLKTQMETFYRGHERHGA